MSYRSDKAKRDALDRLTPKQRAEIARADAEKTLARLRRAAKKPGKEEDTKPPEKYEIDILALEMASGAPNWLSQGSKGLSEKRKQEIRDKHRAKAGKKAKKK